MSCNKKTACSELEQVYVNPYLTNEKGISYCELLSQSIENEASFFTFIKLDIGTDNFYAHGEVLLQLVDLRGEEYFVKAVEKLNKIERFMLRVYLDGGFRETKILPFKEKELKEVFPRLEEALVLD